MKYPTKKIELVCNMHNDRLEISEEIYNFLKKHGLICNANSVRPKHYSLVTTEEKVTEEFI